MKASVLLVCLLSLNSCKILEQGKVDKVETVEPKDPWAGAVMDSKKETPEKKDELKERSAEQEEFFKELMALKLKPASLDEALIQTCKDQVLKEMVGKKKMKIQTKVTIEKNIEIKSAEVKSKDEYTMIFKMRIVNKTSKKEEDKEFKKPISVFNATDKMCVFSLDLEKEQVLLGALAEVADQTSYFPVPENSKEWVSGALYKQVKDTEDATQAIVTLSGLE